MEGTTLYKTEKMRAVSEDQCRFNVLGAVYRQAIKDFVRLKVRKEKQGHLCPFDQREFESATDFIFNPPFSEHTKKVIRKNIFKILRKYRRVLKECKCFNFDQLVASIY